MPAGVRTKIQPERVDALGTVTLEQGMRRYSSLRAGLHRLTWLDDRISHLMTPGLLLIGLFELGSIAVSALIYPGLLWRALPFEIFNAVAAFVCLWLMWTARFKHQWRETVFSFCFIVVLAASSLSLITGRSEPLLMSVMLVLFGAGSVVPWSARWQFALSGLCVAWFSVNAFFWLPQHGIDGLYRWLALLAAAALAQIGNARNDFQRQEFESRAKIES